MKLLGHLPEGSTLPRLNAKLCDDVSQVVVGYVMLTVRKTVADHEEGTVEAIMRITAIEPVGGEEAHRIVERIKEVAREATEGSTVAYKDLSFEDAVESITDPTGTTISFDRVTGEMVVATAAAAEQDDRELLAEAARIVLEQQYASTSMIQRKLRVGFAKAQRLVEMLAERGVVGPTEGTRARDVLMGPEKAEAVCASILAEGKQAHPSPAEGKTEPDLDDADVTPPETD